ncbi:tetratricopeptide repeat protein [Devosia sp. RR2S18]|uniref:tetratricopeptide repeat protein n=1 Tax=Devosia rhizosphaerae TaxID=3049774 RepID=UPI0025404F4A|nr:tetratricopeptide repeat protein [Devosia sp. RR2S18]WIJ26238.1 tetratricopeptide repeat protein [Devosia sp. RR2S18]
MPKTSANEPELDRAAVAEALERVLAQPEIARSPQLAQFLSYIVSRTLEGQSPAIKAYSIAVDVFGRPADFDPQNDPIVRVQARRLRALLDEYYSGAGASEELRIVLPLGRYVPDFVVVPRKVGSVAPLDDEESAIRHIERKRVSWNLLQQRWLGAAAVSTFILVALAYVLWSSRPDPGAVAYNVSLPRVAVADFQTLAGVPDAVPRVSGLALELLTDLQQFGSFDASYVAPGAERLDQNGSDYGLAGVARLEGDRVEFSAILTDTQTASMVWNQTLSLTAAEAGLPGALDEISRSFSLILGSVRGPVHQKARMLLASGQDVVDQQSPYLCRIAFDLYRASSSPADSRRALACFEALPAVEQARATGLAAVASLITETENAAEEPLHMRLATAAEKLQQALSLEPTSAFVWEQQARWHEAQGDVASARGAYGVSIQLNPARGDALAGLARLLAFTGNYKEAEALMEAALKTPDPPPWYFGVPALLALRDGDYERALEAAERYEEADRELGPILALMASQGGANGNVVSRYLPQIMEEPAFRRSGILPRLRLRISDNALMDAIRNALVQAGVPVQALISGF